MTYRAKTLTGAQRRVRELQKQIDTRDEMIGRLLMETHFLARLAAKGPAFFNPLDAAHAEVIRDRVLAKLGMRPDGSFNK